MNAGDVKIIYTSNALQDAQQDAPVAHCDQCEGEMYSEDTVYLWENTRLCVDCIQEKFDCLTVREKAELLGAEMVRARE